MHARGEHFRYRLERSAPRGAMAGCALLLGVVLTAIGVFPIYMTITHDEPGKRGFFYIWGGAFIAVGLLLVYSGIHQFLARATPETIVELDAPTLRRGASIEVLFRQQGPVSLESLRANLVGEERWATWVHRDGTRDPSWHVRHLGTFNFLDHPAVDIPDLLDVFATLDVPPDVKPTRGPHGDDHRSVRWSIEVWGKVRDRADFMHAFPIVVE